MKRTVCLIMATVLLLPMVLSMTACSEPPSLDDVRDRVIALVEASHEINDIFYGKGLPVYEYGDEEVSGLYPVDQDVYYEYVKFDAKYHSIDEIKTAAEKVYAKSFLERSVYTNMFTGYAEQGIGIIYARYKEDGAYLYQRIDAAEDKEYNYTKGVDRIYDYDTMEMTSNSSSERIFVKMNTHKSGESDRVVTLQLVFENNDWYLATATY